LLWVSLNESVILTIYTKTATRTFCFDMKMLDVLPPRECLCVPPGSYNKQIVAPNRLKRLIFVLETLLSFYGVLTNFNNIAWTQACWRLYVVRAAWAKFVLHATNTNFSTQ